MYASEQIAIESLRFDRHLADPLAPALEAIGTAEFELNEFVEMGEQPPLAAAPTLQPAVTLDLTASLLAKPGEVTGKREVGAPPLRGTSRADELVGGSGNDVIMGNGGGDFLSGQDGDDVIRGGAGIDGIVGGKGLDTLYGGGGDDVLIGGSVVGRLGGQNGKTRVRDTSITNMYGGGGSDWFVLNLNWEANIKDFRPGVDQLALTAGMDLGKVTISYNEFLNETVVRHGSKLIAFVNGNQMDTLTEAAFAYF